MCVLFSSDENKLITLDTCRYTALHITDSTDQRNILVVKWWHYIRDKRKTSRCIQVICWTLHSHFVGVKNEMKEAVCLCRRRTHAEMSHRVLRGWRLAGHNQEIWNSNRGWVAIPTLVGITSYPFIHKYPGRPACALANFPNRWQVVVVSQSQVRVCVLFLSVCQVLRVLVHSVLLWVVWLCIICPSVCL